jgi:farnesyl diphosphate synthase
VTPSHSPKVAPGASDPAHAAAALDGVLRAKAAEVDSALQRLLPSSDGLYARVQAAMRYAVLVGGKRLRPFLVLKGSALFGVPEAQAMRAACAIELLHTYSLVHDDLPCMDDDDLRRGQPTTHKKFDEATAVLAGDGLLTLAFEILAHPDTHPAGEARSELVLRLAQAAGSEGMIGGQMIDIEAPGKDFGRDEVILLQRMKTGALFEFSCEAGAILGRAGVEDRARLRDYARDLGLAFQIADDLIDATGTAEAAGKAVGKDAEAGKATMVSLYGVDGARAEAESLARRAAATLDVYGAAAAELKALPFFLIDRKA